MQYWQFFPSGQEGLGCLPVWGFATVCESGVERVQVGRRVWGYWPAGTHLVTQPVRVGPAGFVDGAVQALQANLDMVAGHADAQEGWVLDVHASPEAGRWQEGAAMPALATVSAIA